MPRKSVTLPDQYQTEINRKIITAIFMINDKLPSNSDGISHSFNNVGKTLVDFLNVNANILKTDLRCNHHNAMAFSPITVTELLEMI